MSACVRGLLSVCVVAVLTGSPAQAQDLDQGKSGAKLFAANCTTCHRSARGLTKGRFSWSLSHFLQQHYTSSPDSAQALTQYLQSVDVPPAKPTRAAARSRPQAVRAAEPALRPPARIPTR